MNQMVSYHAAGAFAPAQPAWVSDGRPLGTAEWLGRLTEFLRGFRSGEFWLGRAHDGAQVGLRDDRHVLICGGTRGGKGASYIIPNLAFWPGSALVVDPKGENAMVTARRRANGSRFCEGLGQAVRILDPFNIVRTELDDFSDLRASFNPLDMLHADRPQSVDLAARIADSLIVSESSNDPYWEESARALLKAVLLHVASGSGVPGSERNLLKVREFVMAGDTKTRALAVLNSKDGQAPSGFSFLFSAMTRNAAFGGVVARAGHMLENLEKSGARHLHSIAQIAATNLDFLESPELRKCLSSSSFALNELKASRKGTTVYLCLPQGYMETHFRALRMWLNLAIFEMERLPRQPACGHPVLTIIDEFPALRRMRVVENAAAQIAGFGMKLVFVVQSLAQLKDIYKDNWETIVANCGIKLFFGNDDHFTRDYASKLIGDCETIRLARTQTMTYGRSNSQSYSRTEGSSGSASTGMSGHTANSSSTWGSSRSVSQTSSESWNWSESRGLTESIHKRALVTPDEIGREFGNRADPKALVLISGMQPLRLHRTIYYKDSDFAGYYDFHRDHARPEILAKVQDARRLEAAHQQRMADLAAEKQRRREAQLRNERERQEESARRFLEKKTRIRRRIEIAKTCGQCALAVVAGLVFGVAAVLLTSYIVYVIDVHLDWI